MLCMEELTLPRLEVLHLSKDPGNTLIPTQRWNLPRLRHVYVAVIPSTNSFDRILTFLRRYASQLESLFLIEYPSFSNLPDDFWKSFTALQLLGVRYHVLKERDWSGWTTTPPLAHPFRYPACRDYLDLDDMIYSRRSMRTCHEAVALVIKNITPGKYYLIEDIREDGWETRMIQTDGISPMRGRQTYVSVQLVNSEMCSNIVYRTQLYPDCVMVPPLMRTSS